MSRRRKGSEGSDNGYKQLQWVNHNLSVEDEAEILRWEPDDSTLFAGLLSLVEKQHGVTVKPANDGDGFMAAATGIGDDCPNKGLGLSAYGNTSRDAVMSLLYKHVALFDGHWPQGGSDQKRRFR